MQLYNMINKLSPQQFHQIISSLFPLCDKVSVYFPNEANQEIMTFKNKFLQATDIFEGDEELTALEPKEGFSMVIVAPTSPVKELLFDIKASYHLSFGLIKNDQALLYVGDEGEIVIDTEENIDLSLFQEFKKIK